MFKLISIVIISMIVSACGSERVNDLVLSGVDKTKPGVLIFGDSISIGYTPYVAASRPDLNVLHTPGNNESSTNGVQTIESVLQQRSWQTVIFNHGLWDLPPGPQAVSLDKYKSNLRKEIKIIRRYSPRVVFCLTTGVPADWTSFNNEDISALNAAALEVMIEMNVEVVDLYSVSLVNEQHHISSSDIHWTDPGSKMLADAIAAAL